MEVIQSYFYGAAAKAFFQQSPNEEAPDAGFDDTYQGSQGASTGILGMMEVIQGDFERTIKETTEAEEQAKRDFIEYDRESDVHRGEEECARGYHDRADGGHGQPQHAGRRAPRHGGEDLGGAAAGLRGRPGHVLRGARGAPEPGDAGPQGRVLHPRRPGGRLQRGLPAEVRHDEEVPWRVETAARAVLLFSLGHLR